MAKKKIKLTIGMPMFHDFHGAIFSLQSLRLNENLSNVELLVIDNDPTYPGSPLIKSALEGPLRNDCANARYIPYTEVIGPANAKNKVFEYAEGEYVLCIDSHILFRPGTIAKLLRYYKKNPDTKNLINGPLLYDDLRNTSTHFDDVWRGEMWGIWGTAWITADGQTFTAVDNNGTLKCCELAFGMQELDILPKNIPFQGYPEVLKSMGCRKLGELDSDEFIIPGNGCGLMSCRKDAWLGFNPNFAGFGGEEMYIHEKFRQAGHEAICVGFLKWWHRFGRPEGVQFPLTRAAKVRNYILGHNELGIPLDRVYEHFVTNGLMGPNEWKSILLDNNVKDGEVRMATPNTIYEALMSAPGDIEKHMPKLKELAEKCSSVTEFSHRVKSLGAFASASNRPKIVSYNLEGNAVEANVLKELLPDTLFLDKKPSSEIESIEDTDLLFIDSTHTYDYVSNELKKFAKNVKKYIVFHDTVLFGQRGEDGKDGLWRVITEFLKANRDWFIAWHTDEQYGLTVLSCLPEEKPEKPLRCWIPQFGPGTEMKAILSSIGVNPSPACDCNARARQMDAWGVKGCKEHRDEIIKFIEDGQQRWGWKSRIDYSASVGEELEPPKSIKEKFSVLWKTVTSGLVFKLNPFHPIESLVDEAIRRAEVKEQAGEYEDEF